MAQADVSIGSVAAVDRKAPLDVPIDSTVAAQRTTVASQTRNEARRAARALHEAMAAADTRSAELPKGNGHDPAAGGAGQIGYPRTEVATDARRNGHKARPAGTSEQFFEDAAGSSGQLRSQVSEGVRWGVIASVATQVGRFGFIAVLMRLLGPENFGIVGQATVYITITYIFLHLGTAATIIQRPKLERAEVGSAWWINFVLGVSLAILTVVIAPALAGFFRTEELTTVLRVLAICFVLKAAAVVPMALLYRSMRFRSLGITEILSAFLGGGLAIIAAMKDAGYWALVIQSIAMDAFYLIALLVISGRPVLSWSTSAARGLWSFSSRVMGSELVRYMSENSDNFLVGRFLGATPLGFYALAYRVLQLPMQMLQQAGRVILPTFSRLQDDRERFAHVYARATESIALVVCPAMTLTLLCAPVAVPAVFGDAWAPAVRPLQLLAATTIVYMIFSIAGGVVLAVGRADWEFRWSVFTVVVALISFGIGLQWGITGVAASYLIMTLVLSPIRFMIVQRIIPISARAFLRSLIPAVASSIVMSEVWFLVTGALGTAASGLSLVACGAVAGLAAYVVTARILWPRDFRYHLGFARQVVRGGRV